MAIRPTKPIFRALKTHPQTRVEKRMRIFGGFKPFFGPGTCFDRSGWFLGLFWIGLTAVSPLLFTPAPYLRSFSADSAYYLFRIRTQDQNIIPTQEPRPNGVPQTQYADRRCPLCPGRHLGSEAHMYLSCPVTSSLAHPLISELRDHFPWDVFT